MLQVINLRKERASLITQHQNETSKDKQRLFTLQQENVHLQLKLKGICSDRKEIQTQNEGARAQTKDALKLSQQQRQLAEHTANIKTLEVSSFYSNQ